MKLLIGIVIFLVFIKAALSVGVLFLKILFTILGTLAGIVVFIMLIPLGIGLVSILLIPAIIIGIIVAIIKCIKFIF